MVDMILVNVSRAHDLWPIFLAHVLEVWTAYLTLITGIWGAGFVDCCEPTAFVLLLFTSLISTLHPFLPP